MPYKTGDWGEQAKARSKKRLKYFGEYSRKYVKKFGYKSRYKSQIGVVIPKNIVFSFLKERELKCQLCGKTEKLLIHHKDKNIKNNKFENLVILCRGCHNKVHIRNKK